MKTAGPNKFGSLRVPSGGSPPGTGQWPVPPNGITTAVSEFGFNARTPGGKIATFLEIPTTRAERPSFPDGGVGNVREPGDGLRTGADVQLFVNATDVRVDRRHADVQLGGQFPCRGNRGRAAPKLPLARRKVVRRRRVKRLNRWNNWTILRAMLLLIGEPPPCTSLIAASNSARGVRLQIAAGAG